MQAALQALEVGQQPAALVDEVSPGAGEDDAAADPLEQGDAGLPLETLDLLADRAGREPQRRGGGADRAVLGDGAQGGEGIEVEHGSILTDRAALLHDGG